MRLLPHPPLPHPSLPHLRAAVPALALGAALLAAPGRAGAADHEWHAGLDFGYAALLGTSTWNGFGGGAHLSYTLTDALQVLAEIEATEHPSPGLTVVSSAVGVVYVLDVLRWVPWAGAEIGPAALISGGAASLRLNLAVPFGLDYGVSPRFNVGLGGRYQMLVLGPSQFTTWGGFARAEYVWGK
jgi:hypothetical protein